MVSNEDNSQCSDCGSKNCVESHFCSLCGSPPQSTNEKAEMSAIKQMSQSKPYRKQIPWYNSIWFQTLLLVAMIVFFVLNPKAISRCWPIALVALGRMVYDSVKKLGRIGYRLKNSDFRECFMCCANDEVKGFWSYCRQNEKEIKMTLILLVIVSLGSFVVAKCMHTKNGYSESCSVNKNAQLLNNMAEVELSNAKTRAWWIERNQKREADRELYDKTGKEPWKFSYRPITPGPEQDAYDDWYKVQSRFEK